jgi:hypothetical protein
MVVFHASQHITVMSSSPINGFKFLRQANVFTVPCAQYSRHDGIRGLFVSKAHRRGDLIAKIPLSACVHTHSRSCSVVPLFRRYHSLLFPTRRGGTVLQTESTASSEDSPGGVVSLTLQPFEATLSFCLALHYFGILLAEKGHLPHLISGCESSISIGKWFLSTFPVKRIDQDGSESLFSSTIGEHTSQELHSCIEQLGHGMFDFFMDTFASDDLRRFLDATGEDDIRWSFVSAIYAVRARVFSIDVVGGALSCSHGRSRLHRGGSKAPEKLLVVSPLLNLMNHADAPQDATVAVVISSTENAIVVRAIRDIKQNGEVALDYRALIVDEQHQRYSLHPNISLEEQMDTDQRLAWESRFQLSATPPC